MNLFLPSTAKSRSLVIELIESLFIVKCRPHYIESQHQIGPSNNKLIKIAGSEQIPFPAPGQSIKNGVGAPADGILVLEYVTHSDKTPTPLLLLYSMKWTEATTLLKNETALDLQTIDEEVDKMEIHFNYLQAKKLYVICTGKPCHVENEHLPEDTVVIDKQTFASYFGPTFKSRAHAYHSSWEVARVTFDNKPGLSARSDQQVQIASRQEISALFTLLVCLHSLAEDRGLAQLLFTTSSLLLVHKIVSIVCVCRALRSAWRTKEGLIRSNSVVCRDWWVWATWLLQPRQCPQSLSPSPLAERRPKQALEKSIRALAAWIIFHLCTLTADCLLVEKWIAVGGVALARRLAGFTHPRQ